MGDAGRQSDGQLESHHGGAAQPLGQPPRFLGVGVRRDDRELITTDASGDVAASPVLGERPRDGLQHGVAGLVAVSLTSLELSRSKIASASGWPLRRAAVLLVQALLECAVVEQPGEPVGERLLVEGRER